MKTTITQTAFHEAFERMGRDGQFSHAARVELFKWLEEIDAQGCGVESELDVHLGPCAQKLHGKQFV